MKIAELYAEIGFQFKDENKFDAFESRLKGLVGLAQTLADTLRGITVPTIPSVRATASVSRSRGPSGDFIGPLQLRPGMPGRIVPGMSAFIGPLLPPKVTGPKVLPGTSAFIGPMPQAGAAPTQSMWSGLRSLGELGLKIGGIATLAIAIKKLVSGLTEWMKASFRAGVETNNWTRRSGQSQQTLKQWELASTRMGLAQDEAAQNLEAMVRKQQDILWGTDPGAVTSFNAVGVDPHQSPTGIFEGFRQRTANWPVADAVKWGTAMGMTPEWAAFLHSLKGELPDVSKRIASAEDLRNISSLNSAWKDLTSTMGELGQMVLSFVSGPLGELLKMLTVAARIAGWGTSGDAAVDRHFGTLGQAYLNMGGMLPRTSVTNHFDTTINTNDARSAAREFGDRVLDNAAAKAQYQRPPPMLGGP